MSVSLSFKIALCSLLLTGQALMAGLLPFNSKVVLPQEYIIHIESAAWLDANGEIIRLTEEPLQADLLQTDIVDLSESLRIAKEHNFAPVSLQLCICRYFDITGEANVEGDKGSTRLHTRTDLPFIEMHGTRLLSLAAIDEDPATRQRCHFPQSEPIDSRLEQLGVKVQGDGSLMFDIPIDSSWLDLSGGNVMLSLTCAGVEFGDSGFGACFIVPHLPYINLMQAAPAVQTQTQ